MQPRCSQLDYGGRKWQHHWPGQQGSSLLLLTYLPGCMPMLLLLMLLLSKSTGVSFMTGRVLLTCVKPFLLCRGNAAVRKSLVPSYTAPNPVHCHRLSKQV